MKKTKTDFQQFYHIDDLLSKTQISIYSINMQKLFLGFFCYFQNRKTELVIDSMRRAEKVYCAVNCKNSYQIYFTMQ